MKSKTIVAALAALCCLVWAAEEAVSSQNTAVRVQNPTIGNRELAIGDGADAITIPRMLSYQGKLTDASGNPVPNGNYTVVFRLYTTPTGPTSYWDETQTVRCSLGLFSVRLGSVRPIDSFPQAGACYLGVKVGADPEMVPRMQLVSAGYAYLSGKSDTANYARAALPIGAATGDLAGTYPNPTVDGLQGRGVAATAPGTNQVLKWSGGTWQPADDLVGSGDNAWVRGTPDSVLYTVRNLGIARGGANNALYGGDRWTHVNLGGACTTGTSGQNYYYCTVGGGSGNTASRTHATVGGGADNTASYDCATVGGGFSNTGSRDCATVGGGAGNTASGDAATVGGGFCNTGSGEGATVGGGWCDTTKAPYGGVFSGISNLAGDAATDTGACVAGGWDNSATAKYSTVAGGKLNQATADYAVIAGGSENVASHYHTSVGGGYQDSAIGWASTVAGGANGKAGGDYAAVGGGWGNAANGSYSVTPGGSENLARADWSGSLSGFRNVAGSEASDSAAVVAGGGGNEALAKYATVGGGWSNSVADGSDWATVAGGWDNSASGQCAFVGGGALNTASGHNAMIPGGGQSEASGDCSFAAGARAKARHHGSFVWADNSVGADLATSANYQWLVRTSGGAWFFTNSGHSSGVWVGAGGNSWNGVSDSTVKENYRPVDRGALLDAVARMRVREYNLKSQDPTIRHIGPVAQEFHNAFGYGESSTAINMQDADGVALAAIQALYEQVKVQQAEIEALKAELKRR